MLGVNVRFSELEPESSGQNSAGTANANALGKEEVILSCKRDRERGQSDAGQWVCQGLIILTLWIRLGNLDFILFARGIRLCRILNRVK